MMINRRTIIAGLTAIPAVGLSLAAKAKPLEVAPKPLAVSSEAWIDSLKEGISKVVLENRHKIPDDKIHQKITDYMFGRSGPKGVQHYSIGTWFLSPSSPMDIISIKQMGNYEWFQIGILYEPNYIIIRSTYDL